MILSGKTLREYASKGAPLVSPFVSEKSLFYGMSYGASIAGYDIRLAEDTHFRAGFTHLVSSVELFNLPENIVGKVKNKSSLVRQGLDAARNTVIEPGWKGYLTLEPVYNPVYKEGQETQYSFFLPAGAPIAQILFEYTDTETEGYNGKYQGQGRGPVEAIFEVN